MTNKKLIKLSFSEETLRKIVEFGSVPSTLHVIPRKHRWAVTYQRSGIASKIMKTQEEAVEFARRFALKESDPTENRKIIIHKKDGSIYKILEEKGVKNS